MNAASRASDHFHGLSNGAMGVSHETSQFPKNRSDQLRVILTLEVRMIRNEIRIQVGVPVEEAFAFMAETTRWVDWMESVKDAKLDGAFESGSVVSVDYTEGVSADMVLEDVKRPSGYAYTADSKDMTIHGDMRFTADGGQTTIEYRETIDPKSFMMKVMKPLIAGGTKRALEKDFASAKQMMEERR
jgi:hypothetical protein